MKRTAKMYKAAVGVALFLALTFTLARPGFTQTTIPAPGFLPSGVAYDGTFLYVSELSGFRTIYKLDPTTGAVLGSFLAPGPAGLFNGNGNPNDLVADGEGRLFVSDISNTVYEIDDAGTTMFNSFSLPFRGGAIAFDGTNLYIGDFDSSQVLVTDRFGNVIRTFDSGLRPAGMVFDPTAGHLSVISEFDATVSEITTDGQLIRSCDGPRDPGVSTHGGFGGIARVGSQLYIGEVSDPDLFTPPDIPGTIFIVDPGTLTCTPPFNSDLALSLIDTPDPVVVGSTLTYALEVVNNGPDPASQVVVIDKFPLGVTLLGVVASQGACDSLTPGTIICELGSLANAASATVTIQVRPTVAGTLSTRAKVTVAATELDPNLADNTATASTTVIGKADLALSLTDEPDPVVVGSTLTYTLIIVNNGSGAATNVVVTDKLPTGVTLLGTVTSQGECGEGPTGTVTCRLGTLANGAFARAAIQVRPTVGGRLISKATVRATEFDPNLTDNTATASTTVILP